MMSQWSWRRLALSGGCLALLSACTCNLTQQAPAPVEETVVPQPVVDVPEETSQPEEEPAIPGFIDRGGETIVIDGERPVNTTFYFEFDEATLSAGDLARLQTIAEALRRNRGQSAVLEGHCDERGTQTYNLALGERRGNAVMQYLQSQGVSSTQLEVVSFGEETPAATGSTEEAWAQNRRVVIKFP